MDFPAIDSLMRDVAKLEALAKRKIAAAQRGERCICSCHDNPTIIHIGPLCCERATGDIDP
jgi:hypothetical protein